MLYHLLGLSSYAYDAKSNLVFFVKSDGSTEPVPWNRGTVVNESQRFITALGKEFLESDIKRLSTDTCYVHQSEIRLPEYYIAQIKDGYPEIRSGKYGNKSQVIKDCEEFATNYPGAQFTYLLMTTVCQVQTVSWS